MSEASTTNVMPFAIGTQNTARFGDGRLAVIAGTCVIESPEHALMVARECANAARRVGVDYVFKASFDKANRSSHKSFRGLGMEAGLEVLAHIKKEIGVPVTTDVHDTAQVERVAEVVDMLQIPAFLCRQTDLLHAAASTGRAVNVKKGQFLAPQDAANIVEKMRAAGCEKLLLTERGASFGYNNLVVDMRSLVIMRGFGVPVVLDATHSLQLPGGLGHATGGQPQFIEPLARAGVACGIDAVFLEVHDRPREALSDATTQYPLDKFEPLIAKLAALHDVVHSRSKQSE